MALNVLQEGAQIPVTLQSNCKIILGVLGDLMSSMLGKIME